MNEPIKAGDLAEVIDGLAGPRSPNIGLIVKVLTCQGEHTRLGRIWRCVAPEVKQLHDSGQGYTVTGIADFAASWLRKIEPPKLTDTLPSRELETQ